MLPGLTRSLPAPTQAPARTRLWLHGFGSSETFTSLTFTGNERASQPRYPVLVISPFPGYRNQLNRTPPGHTPSPRTCAHEPQGHLSWHRYLQACRRTLGHGLKMARSGTLSCWVPTRSAPATALEITPHPPTLSHRAQLCANGQLLLTALKTLEALESVRP